MYPIRPFFPPCGHPGELEECSGLRTGPRPHSGGPHTARASPLGSVVPGSASPRMDPDIQQGEKLHTSWPPHFLTQTPPHCQGPPPATPPSFRCPATSSCVFPALHPPLCLVHLFPLCLQLLGKAWGLQIPRDPCIEFWASVNVDRKRNTFLFSLFFS